MAVVMVATFAACSTEIIYMLDATEDGAVKSGTGNNADAGKQSGNASSGNSSSGNASSGNSGKTPAVEDTTGDGTTYKLRVWCAEEDVGMIWDMLYAYADKYHDNTYIWTVEKQGEDTVASKVLQDPSAAADVFSFANDQLGNMVNQNALVQIPITYEEQINNQIEFARTACRSGGQCYAFPYSYENCFLYYNKSLISASQVGNLEELLNADIAGVTYNLGIDMGDSYYTTMFLYTAGVEIFGEKGNDPNSVDLANDAAVKACEYIASLSSKSKLGTVAKNDQFAALKNKKVAAMISGPHMISLFKDALGDANFGVAKLPTIKLPGDGDKKTQLISFSGVKMYGVSRNTESRDDKTTAEAIKLASYLANADNQKIRLDEREFCPTDADLFDEAIDSGIPTVEVVVEQSEDSRLKPGLVQMSNYWENMAAFLLGVYKQTKPSDTWMDELRKIEAKLKQ
jgi:arabinogalactan oligomer/maltooligosaccharide transport system substrate-binding protein